MSEVRGIELRSRRSEVRSRQKQELTVSGESENCGNPKNPFNPRLKKIPQ